MAIDRVSFYENDHISNGTLFDKERCFELAYYELELYKSSYLNNADKKLITAYKIQVIAARITEAFGFPFSIKIDKQIRQKLTNQEVCKASDHTMKKLKKALKS